MVGLLDIGEMRLSCQVGGFLYSLIDFGSQLITPVRGDPQS